MRLNCWVITLINYPHLAIVANKTVAYNYNKIPDKALYRYLCIS